MITSTLLPSSLVPCRLEVATRSPSSSTIITLNVRLSNASCPKHWSHLVLLCSLTTTIKPYEDTACTRQLRCPTTALCTRSTLFSSATRYNCAYLCSHLARMCAIRYAWPKNDPLRSPNSTAFHPNIHATLENTKIILPIKHTRTTHRILNLSPCSIASSAHIELSKEG